jgi:hypothetical protein
MRAIMRIAIAMPTPTNTPATLPVESKNEGGVTVISLGWEFPGEARLSPVCVVLLLVNNDIVLLGVFVFDRKLVTTRVVPWLTVIVATELAGFKVGGMFTSPDPVLDDCVNIPDACPSWT